MKESGYAVKSATYGSVLLLALNIPPAIGIPLY
jgi:hypothetical protein